MKFQDILALHNAGKLSELNKWWDLHRGGSNKIARPFCHNLVIVTTKCGKLVEARVCSNGMLSEVGTNVRVIAVSWMYKPKQSKHAKRLLKSLNTNKKEA